MWFRFFGEMTMPATRNPSALAKELLISANPNVMPVLKSPLKRKKFALTPLLPGTNNKMAVVRSRKEKEHRP